MIEMKSGYGVELLVVTHIMSEFRIATENIMFCFEDRDLALAFIDVEIPRLNHEYRRHFDIPANDYGVVAPVTLVGTRRFGVPASLDQALARVREAITDGEAVFLAAMGQDVPDGAALLAELLKKDR